MTLTEIGVLLEHLITVLRRYDSDGEAMASIDESIKCIEDEDRKRCHFINFYGLQNHRSTSSDYGSSLLQEHRSVFLQANRYLESNAHFRSKALAFITNPSLLIENCTAIL